MPLEHGLERYEQRHPDARGVVQGSVVVLKNRDGSVLAETGGRQVYQGRETSYSDFNRVRRSMRQPGSAMKPIVYLAAFRHGDFTLETLVPDEPISVPMGSDDGRRNGSRTMTAASKGSIPIREALAESRNAVAIWITGQIGIDAVLQDVARVSACRRRCSAIRRRRSGRRNELAGTGDGVSHDCIGRPHAAVRDSTDRPRFGRSGALTRSPPVSRSRATMARSP